MEHPEAKFVRGDRVTVSEESTEELAHLFPNGLDTYEGIVTSVRLDYSGGWGSHPRVFKAWVYSVQLEQDRSKGNLTFLETDLTLVRPYVVTKLDKVIDQLEEQIVAIRFVQNAELKSRGLA